MQGVPALIAQGQRFARQLTMLMFLVNGKIDRLTFIVSLYMAT
jgi:hypothetical protein